MLCPHLSGDVLHTVDKTSYSSSSTTQTHRGDVFSLGCEACTWDILGAHHGTLCLDYIYVDEVRIRCNIKGRNITHLLFSLHIEKKLADNMAIGTITIYRIFKK